MPQPQPILKQDIIKQNVIAQISATLKQPRCRKTAFRVALFVGTVLFSINHGSALLNQEMSRDRWLSAAITYCIPFMVSIHGQSSTRQRSARQRSTRQRSAA